MTQTQAFIHVYAENCGRYHACVLDSEQICMHATASLPSAHAARCAAETWMAEHSIQNLRPSTPSTSPETPTDADLDRFAARQKRVEDLARVCGWTREAAEMHLDLFDRIELLTDRVAELEAWKAQKGGEE